MELEVNNVLMSVSPTKMHTQCLCKGLIDQFFVEASSAAIGCLEQPCNQLRPQFLWVFKKKYLLESILKLRQRWDFYYKLQDGKEIDARNQGRIPSSTTMLLSLNQVPCRGWPQPTMLWRIVFNGSRHIFEFKKRKDQLNSISLEDWNEACDDKSGNSDSKNSQQGVFPMVFCGSID